MGAGCCGEHLGSDAILHRIPENQWPVRQIRRGLSSSYTSANAPEKRDVLGTLLLSVLAGHWRYAHISAIRSDGVNPELLGMTNVASEDSVRRAMKALDEGDSARWLKEHLKASYEPLLQEPWILDVNSTVRAIVRTSARRQGRI